MLSNFILLVFVQGILNYITFDSGLSSNFDEYIRSCFYSENGFTRTTAINFSGQFRNVPQLLLTLGWVVYFTDQTQLQWQITSISQSCIFILTKVRIFNTSRLWILKKIKTSKIRWFAIDDQRGGVLNNFNAVNPDNQTFKIKNTNAQTGFEVLNSIHYTGAIDFLLSVIINNIKH